MLKRELSKGLFRYVFEPLPGHRFCTNIYALVSGGSVLLIDSGYAFMGEQVLGDINECGWNIEGVIISHFHDDHMEGLKVLPDVTVYGSGRYNETLELWTEKDERHYYTPSVLIENERTIAFKEHAVRMIPFPGHSPCTLLTLIDDKYLHIADELIFSEQGEPVLPVTDPGCIQRHADALCMLKRYGRYLFMPGHGPEFSGSNSIHNEIDKRLAYYNAILSAGREITYEEAIIGCGGGFLHSEWHADIYE